MNEAALVRSWIVVDASTTYQFSDLAGNCNSGNETVQPRTDSPMPTYTAAASGGLCMNSLGKAVSTVVVRDLVLLQSIALHTNPKQMYVPL
jgi:hypothetical protein